MAEVNEFIDQATASPSPESPPSSTGKKIAMGCGCGCLGLFLLGLILTIGGSFWAMGKLDELKQEFVDMGMKEGPFSQVLVVTKPPTEPTFYVGQVVRIEVDTDVPIGILAQTAEMNGVASEKVYFRGQVIQVGPGGHLQQGLDVKCQVVQASKGRIDGGVTGPAQVVNPANLRN